MIITVLMIVDVFICINDLCSPRKDGKGIKSAAAVKARKGKKYLTIKELREQFRRQAGR